jgi:V8-like Glu-specific endopeptidase
MTVTVMSAAFGLAAATTPATAEAGVSQLAAAVTYNVSVGAQQTAAAFWTAARMADAVGDGGVPDLAAYPAASADGALAASAGGALAAAPPKGTPTAVEFGGVKTVGALFYTTGTQQHFCTASVTDSAHGDLVITAAHCVYNTSYTTNIAYVPMYHAGKRPYGTWAVKSVIIPSQWRTAHDPNYDVAFLQIAPHGGTQVQAVTGGLALGLNGSYVRPVEVIGYNDSESDPVRCAARSFEFRAGQQEFYCYNFWNGTSGGPWITGYNPTTGAGYVTGVIGGYQEGGDLNWASYSPYFGPAVGTLYQQAEKAG